MWLESQIFLLFLVISVISRSTVVGDEKAAEDDKRMYLPASGEEKNFLAENVCTELDVYLGSEEAVRKCKDEFRWNMDPDQSGSEIRCRSNTSITYKVAHSNLYQLILLVPEFNYYETGLIHSIVQPGTNYQKIDIMPGTSYKVFSTVLDKHGRPLVWHREARVQSWAAPAPREYNVLVELQNNSNSIDALLTWNQTGELDACFNLNVRCDSRARSYQRLIEEILPDSLPRKLFKDLPLNDLCRVTLKGLYGTTKTEFRTTAHNVTEELKLSTPQHIFVEAEEDGDSWTVRVRWAQPGLPPDSYNVTLRADNMSTIVLNGNAREVTFKGVTGEGLYNVSLCAILGKNKRYTSRRAIFPASNRSVWRWASVAGGAWGVVCVAAVATAVWRLRFRGRLGPPEKLSSIDIKAAEDQFLEEHIESWLSDGWEIKSERLVLHEVIGEGAFGVVRRGTLAPHGKEVAVKMLKDFPSLDEMRSFRLEMELMKSVGAHPHVVSLVGCCSGRRPLIVAEYCSRGDLLSFLRCTWDVMVSKRNAKYYNNNIDASDYRNDLFKCKLPQEQSRLVVNKMYDLQGLCDTEITSRDLLSFCRQIAMGMEFLASNRLVHRDLAARNILVTGDRTLKIADFGLSRDVYEENQYKQTGNGKMPVKWMALESLTRRIYTTQSDVWSFGVVVWEVATVGGAPYPEVPAARLPRLLRAGYRMPRPANCSKPLYELMQSCWRAKPRSRPTFAELHARLDELLACACADEYLSLELDDEPPPAPRAHRYFKMILRAKRNWTWGESYERPLKAPHIRYTSPPVIVNKTPV